VSRDGASDCTWREASTRVDMSCSPENNCLVIELSACHQWWALFVFQIFIFLSPKQILFSSRKLLNNTGLNRFLICPFISLLFPPCAFRTEVAALEILCLSHHSLCLTRYRSCLTPDLACWTNTRSTLTRIPLISRFHLILKIIPTIDCSGTTRDHSVLPQTKVLCVWCTAY